jgi:hypothetical protein
MVMVELIYFVYCLLLWTIQVVRVGVVEFVCLELGAVRKHDECCLIFRWR